MICVQTCHYKLSHKTNGRNAVHKNMIPFNYSGYESQIKLGIFIIYEIN